MFIVYCMLWCTGPGYAQGFFSDVDSVHRRDPETLETTRSYQNEPVKAREFDEEKWRNVVGDTDYTEKERPERKAKVEAPAGISWDPDMMRVIAYFIVGCGLMVLLYFVLHNLPFRMPVKKKIRQDGDGEHVVEDIETLDAAALLQDAIRQRDFKLAIRLYYLGLLKLLNEKGLIHWKKDKTNREYLAELFTRNAFFDDVRRLTVFYESVWYGEHDVKDDTFYAMGSRFETLMGRINNSTESP